VCSAAEDALWVEYPGGDGPGKGKHLVLIAACDAAYHPEEAMPQIGKILSRHHGFRCSVLFTVDPKNGNIANVPNIPGLEALKTADLMIVFARFCKLPDDQMQPIVDYIESGKPIIGIRGATHAFALPPESKFAKYSMGGGADYRGGFGRQVLGERWQGHHGTHGKEGTRGILVKEAADHPILRGIKDGDIWGVSDVYAAKPLAPFVPLVLGQVLVDNTNVDAPPVEGKKNDPMMPIAWTRTYRTASGKDARVFTTTMGSSQDFAVEGTRRMLVNGCYWCVGLEDKIAARSKVDLVGEYQPTAMGKGSAKGAKPADHAMSK
jgi:type 1 glutamine amidotransferase